MLYVVGKGPAGGGTLGAFELCMGCAEAEPHLSSVLLSSTEPGPRLWCSRRRSCMNASPAMTLRKMRSGDI